MENFYILGSCWPRANNRSISPKIEFLPNGTLMLSLSGIIISQSGERDLYTEFTALSAYLSQIMWARPDYIDAGVHIKIRMS
jgi:hypothetical protein